jgi:exosortase
MSTSVEASLKAPPVPRLPWPTIAWFGALLVAGYVPVLAFLISTWSGEDMGHGYFVPVIAGYIVWQSRHELMALEPRPNWWGLVVVLYAAVQLFVATLGVEVFLARTSFVIALFGIVLALGGTAVVKKLAFPLFLLFFMIPIPAVAYNRITFPLQILASKLATDALTLVGIPVLREGNILELPTQRLSVVEACSGIRSLLSLTFLAMVYGYFFEKRSWLRVLLFIATIPIAILANASRITVTGILSQFKPELAEGFFHESTGWVIFMIAFAILIGFHKIAGRIASLAVRRRHS